MSFKTIFPNIAGARPDPPPAEIRNVAALIRIDVQETPVLELENKFLFRYVLSTGIYGYLYACLRPDETDVEALFSINESEPYLVEVIKLGSTEEKLYYNSVLQATFEYAPDTDTVYEGYYAFIAYGYAWLTDWTYRKRFRVTGTTAGAQTNYQVKLTVNRSSGTDSGTTVYLGTKCKADFSDLRFTSEDGETELDYWIESIVGTVCTVWVELASIRANPLIDNFFIYYGNASASDESSGDNTFLFFEDFSSDLSKWADTPAGWSISGGKVVATAAGHLRAIISDYTNVAFQVIVSLASNVDTARRIYHFNSDDSEYCCIWANWFHDKIELLKTGEVNAGSNALVLDINTDYRFELRKIGSDWSIWVDDVEIDSAASWITMTLYKISLSTENTTQTEWDNVILRNIADPEPSISSWGSEETE